MLEELELIKGLIYRSVCINNDKCYIGQTTQGLAKRMYEHIQDTKSNRDKFHFHNALRKYGFDNFKWEVLETCKDKYSLDLAEQWYIRVYKSLNKNKGYNKSIGGSNINTVLSEEHKRRISEAHKGKKKSAEHLRKIGETRIRKKIGFGSKSKQAKKFVITTPEGNMFMIHGLKDFTRKYTDYNLDFRLLSAVAKGKRTHTKQHRCEYYDEIKHNGLEMYNG